MNDSKELQEVLNDILNQIEYLALVTYSNCEDFENNLKILRNKINYLNFNSSNINISKIAIENKINNIKQEILNQNYCKKCNCNIFSKFFCKNLKQKCPILGILEELNKIGENND